MFISNARKRKPSKDPTRTTLVRQAYAVAIFKRLRTLLADIKVSIVDRDCFGLSGGVLSILRANEVAGYQQFAFTSDARKHDAFMAWLREQIEKEVLETVDRNGNSVDPDWQDTYVRAAYERGTTQAVAEVVRVLPQAAPLVPVSGSFFFQPVHATALELLFTRNFEALKGITDAMASAISRELTLAFAQGLPSIQIAKNIADNVKGIGLVRARTLARTEVIHAHAQATLNVYEQMGITEVGVEPEVEFTTANDAIVCGRCRALSGKIYSVQKARGVIPVHPNCRCAWIPVVIEQKVKKAA